MTMPVVSTGRVVAKRGEETTRQGQGQEGQKPRTDTAGDVAHDSIVLIGRSTGWTASPGWQLRVAKTLPTTLYLQGCHSLLDSHSPRVWGGGRVNVITDTMTLVETWTARRSGEQAEPFVVIEGGQDAAEEADWQERALCAQTDPEAFFPEKGGSTREAKRICSGCEVRAECLDYALAHDERFGIWGGLSERERRRLRRPAVWALRADPSAAGVRGFVLIGARRRPVAVSAVGAESGQKWPLRAPSRRSPHGGTATPVHRPPRPERRFR